MLHRGSRGWRENQIINTRILFDPFLSFARIEDITYLFLLCVKMLELLQNLVIGSSFKQDCAIAEVCLIARVKM